MKLIQILSENYGELVHLYPSFRELTWNNSHREDIPSTPIVENRQAGSIGVSSEELQKYIKPTRAPHLEIRAITTDSRLQFQSKYQLIFTNSFTMAPKWITAVLASCLSGAVLAAPTATTDNLIVKRASINDVSDSLLNICQLCLSSTLTH